MGIKKLLKNLSITTFLSIAVIASFVRPAFANNTCVIIDSKGNETIEEVPEAIDEEEEAELKKEKLLETSKIFKNKIFDLFNPGLSTFAVIDEDERENVTNTRIRPYKSICYVHAIFPKGNKISSGWICRDDVLVTSAHSVYDADLGGAFTELLVIPAREPDGNAPYGTVKINIGATKSNSQIAFIPSEYITMNKEHHEPKDDIWPYDYAAIRLPKAIGKKCGHIYTSSKDKYLDYHVQIPGYPQYKDIPKDDPKNYTMVTNFGAITGYDNNLLYHEVDTTIGQSGAPVLVETLAGFTAIGIYTGGVNKQNNRAVRTTDTVKNLILKARNN